MSTGAASRPARRTTIAVALLVIAAVVLAVMSAAAWGLAQEFVSWDMLVFGALPWAVLPAGLIAAAVSLLGGRGRGGRATWLVLVLAWAGIVVLVSGLALASRAVHAEDAARPEGGGQGWTELVTEIRVV
ncbi:MAG: hypothetical protein AB7O74_15570 [Candidatus Nanopelagicales bacterium]